MTTPARPASPSGRPPAEAAALLPMLVWLNRRALATRFPGWEPAALIDDASASPSAEPLQPLAYTDGCSTPT